MTEEAPSGPYRPVPKILDRVALEHEVLARWDAARTFTALRQQGAAGEPFSFLDGPITANNPMGVHHAWGRTMKDVIQRYQAMNGRRLRWQNGFDCQGLWVEVEVERSLGFNSKREIEAFGLDRFALACRERVATCARTIIDQSARLGMWMDWDASYYTMTDTNISYIWGFLAECHRRGWLYQGHRLMPWCHRCGTSLSQHELADSYAELSHPSVFLRLPLQDAEGEHVAVWTTTPWTLPANVAVAVAPDATYALVRTANGDVWVAERRLGEVALSGPVLRSMAGSELVGRRYLPPLSGLSAQQEIDHRVIAWDDVSLEEGTGAVHIAPGCGTEDFELSQARQLPVLVPIDGEGRYLAGYGWLTGRVVTDVDDDILEHLQTEGRLLHAGRLTHRYPQCWRCATPLVHRVVDEWFIASEEIRQAMRDAAVAVSWRPAHYAKRMDDWLANMGDWCISRKRYWGLPLPFYFCPAGHLSVISSKQELEQRALGGLENLRELHRPWIDAVVVACQTCGDQARRVAEVGDCWLDAGIVAFSTLGWHNLTARPAGYADGAGVGLTVADLPDHHHWERWFPAEVVCEMHEQIRLWFYSLLFMSVTLDGRAPYRRVLTYGRVRDETGREMHKSWGNAIWFNDAVEHVGADTMRWLYASQPPSRDLNFGYGRGQEAARRFLSFWNSYAFFITYANLDGFRPVPGLHEHGPNHEGMARIDHWLAAGCQQLIRQSRDGLDRLDLPAVTATFDRFADDLSNWYVRLTRQRFWGAADTPDKRAAYQTLWYALVTGIRCLAPIMPFIADAIWDNLVSGVLPGAPISVHLSGYPGVVAALDDREALAAMDEARKVTELGRAIRSAADIRRRQPLARLLAVNADPAACQRVSALADLVAQECNVKSVSVLDHADEFSITELTADFTKLGPKFRQDAPRIAALLKAGRYTREGDRYRVGDVIVEEGEVQVRIRARPGFAVAEGDGWVVALDTTINATLSLEGRARDLVRRIQQLRKDHDLPVTARIDVTYPAGEYDVVDAFGAWIGEQTLARSLSRGPALQIKVT